VRDGDEIGEGAWGNLAELTLMAEGFGGVAGDGFEELIWGKPRFGLGEGAKFFEEAEGGGAGEGIGGGAEIEAEVVEAAIGERGMREVAMRAWAMDDGWGGVFGEGSEEREIGFGEFVEVGEDPAAVDGLGIPEESERGGVSAIGHGALEGGEEIVKGT